MVWCHRNQLQINTPKTREMVLDERRWRRYLSLQLDNKLDGSGGIIADLNIIISTLKSRALEA